MTTQLSSTDLSDISSVLTALNGIWKDTITSDIVVQWPDSLSLTFGSDTIGFAKFHDGMEQWVFEPLGNFPPPPTF